MTSAISKFQNPRKQTSQISVRSFVENVIKIHPSVWAVVLSHTDTQSHTHTHTHIPTHTNVIHTYTYIHTHTHTNIQTYTQPWFHRNIFSQND